jgi:nicotinamidase/pyrazinamidase
MWNGDENGAFWVSHSFSPFSLVTALLIVDVQNDFCPAGALAVPEGGAVVPVVNRLMEADVPVVLTQDWHPPDHLSFASQHEGLQPYDTVELAYGEQILWPDHCVQGTGGAEFHPDLDPRRAELIIRKGFRREIDSYSTFRENDKQTPTGLVGYLRERGIDHLVIAGLATDFCVKWSVEDAVRNGFGVTVIEDGVRGIDIDGSLDEAFRTMRELEARLMRSDDWLAQHGALAGAP